jgi:IclR family mhp operon transcriptional activator
LEKDASIRAIARCIAVLQAINRHGSLTLTQIAADSAVPYPTATRIVRTLVGQGLIEREPSRKRYRPTALIQTLSCGFQNHDRLVSAARPHIVELTHRMGWPISIATRVGRVMVVRDSTSSLTPLTFNHYYPGWHVPLLASASGRVYFAHADAEVQRELITHLNSDGAEAEMLLLREFQSGDVGAKIREQGFAAVARTSYSANPGKTSSIAVPLFEDGVLLGSLALVFFATALPLSDAIPRFLPALRETAENIQREMEAGAGLAQPAAARAAW